MELFDLRPQLERFIAESYPGFNADRAGKIVEETLLRVKINHVDDDPVDRLRAATDHIRHQVLAYLRGEDGAESKRPAPAMPPERYLGFFPRLGRKEAEELVRWQSGMTPEECAAEAGILVTSVRRLRRRISGKWKDYLNKHLARMPKANVSFHKNYIQDIESP